MTQKKLLRPERRRQIPAQFSWLDHRLVRDNRLTACEPPALALYLVLVTVADAQGVAANKSGPGNAHTDEPFR